MFGAGNYKSMKDITIGMLAALRAFIPLPDSSNPLFLALYFVVG